LQSLQNGWANLIVSHSGLSHEYDLSYIGGDSLSELVDVAVKLLHGQSSTQSIYLEPEYMAIEYTARTQDHFTWEADNSSTECSSMRFARQVLSLFSSYLLNHTATEYQEQWHYTFPSEKLKQLQEDIQQHQE
jgi:hypothetical protein